MGELTIFVCKTCGRAIKAEKQPFYCYFDRMTSIENISDEDAIKMGLFKNLGREILLANRFDVDDVSTVLHPFIIEFYGDMRYNPMTGDKFGPPADYFPTLNDFQNEIMQEVVKG